MHRVLLAAYVVYLTVAAYLVFWPQPDTPSGAVSEVLSGLEWIGISAISGVIVEFALNIMLFVPMTLLGVLLWPRINPLLWVLTGLGATMLIEFIQYAALPDRSATLSDIVANTLGAFIGMDLGLRVRWLVSRWWKRSTPDEHAGATTTPDQ